MITIGRMAERYNMLPHQVAQNATTYDLMICDVLATYEKYEQSKTKNAPFDPKLYNIKTEDLQKILNLSKNNGK